SSAVPEGGPIGLEIAGGLHVAEAGRAAEAAGADLREATDARTVEACALGRIGELSLDGQQVVGNSQVLESRRTVEAGDIGLAREVRVAADFEPIEVDRAGTF